MTSASKLLRFENLRQHTGRVLCAVLVLTLAHIGASGPFAACAIAQETEIEVVQSVPDSLQNQLFVATEGWIGGDGIQSVRLDANRILWLFSDTWVGRIENGRRVDATIVNNTLSVQTGVGAAASNQFFISRTRDERPVAWIKPDDGRGWFWLQAATRVNNQLVLFLTQVDRTEGDGVFAFKAIGQSFGIVSNPDADISQWQITQQKIPACYFDEKREVMWGGGLIEHEGYVVIYGSDEDVFPKRRERYLVVARVAKDKLLDVASWEYLGDEGWIRDPLRSKRTVPKMACDCSVVYIPRLERYLLSYTENGLSDKILARTATSPWGPWSPETVLYECPEMQRDRRIFCYNGRVQPILSEQGLQAPGDTIELTLSYASNSFELAHVADDLGVYMPRFVRVSLRKPQ